MPTVKRDREEKPTVIDGVEHTGEYCGQKVIVVSYKGSDDFGDLVDCFWLDEGAEKLLDYAQDNRYILMVSPRFTGDETDETNRAWEN